MEMIEKRIEEQVNLVVSIAVDRQDYEELLCKKKILS